MYPSILKGKGNRSGSNKEQKLQQKQGNRSFSAFDPTLPTEEIVDLKNALLIFKKSLKTFSGIAMDASSCNHGEAIKKLHMGLGDVLDTLRTIIDKYPTVSTSEVYFSVEMLVTYVQKHRDSSVVFEETERLINQLALYFTKSISQYLIQLRDAYDKPLKSPDKVQRLKEEKSSSAIFGMELERHLNASKLEIPFVVSKCIKEIEDHGMFVNGIYRVSAVKSKVNQLCEAFEKYGHKVNLNDVNPNIIANVLKLYLRELPQPLFTFELYPEFIRIAKLYAAESSEENKKRSADELRKVLAKLPKCYYTVVAAVMQHLHRISNEATLNNMTAYNLAVIFGPTLLHSLRNSSQTGSKAALFDSVHQIRAIELMITWADSLFGQ